MIKVGAETHLGGGDMSAFVSPLATIARALHRLPVAVLFLGKAHEDSDHTAVIADAYMPNSPCWLNCECCNNVLSSFWSPLLAIG